MGFDNACNKAEPVLLEPVMTVDIMTPKEYVGEVISQVTMRGGIVESLESRTSIEHIRAHSPLAKMFGYSTSLRSSTQGEGHSPWNFHTSRKRKDSFRLQKIKNRKYSTIFPLHIKVFSRFLSFNRDRACTFLQPQGLKIFY
jgi:translation elongation factor EF-G